MRRHNWAISLFVCILTIVPFLIQEAEAQTLPRVDDSWVLGYEPIDTGPFGRTTITFADSVFVDSLLVFPPFEFDWTNKSYHIPQTSVSIFSNGCAVTRNLSDTIFRIDQNQTSTFLFNRLCSQGIGTEFSTFLPLGEDTIALVHGLRFRGDPQLGFFNHGEGDGIAYLLVDSLLASDNASSAVVASPTLCLPGDTLQRNSVGITAHPLGGWWIVSKGIVETNRYRVIHLKADTIIEKELQYVGAKSALSEDYGVRFVFGPSGTQFTSVGNQGGIELFNFNLFTGEISLKASLAPPNSEWDFFYHFMEAAWSADEQYLYIADEMSAWQLRTDALPLESGWVRIDPPARPGRRNAYFELSRGPDCRIYVGPPGGSTYLSVIDKPQQLGTAVDFKNRGLPTKFIYVGIPKFPDYHTWSRVRVARGLAPLIDTAVCDSTIVAYDYAADPVSSTFSVKKSDVQSLRLWPSLVAAHQAGQVLNIEWSQREEARSENYTVTIADAKFTVVASVAVVARRSVESYEAELSLQALSAGYYTLTVLEEGSNRVLGAGTFVVQ